MSVASFHWQVFKAVFIPRNLDDVDDYEKDILKVQEGQTDEVRNK